MLYLNGASESRTGVAKISVLGKFFLKTLHFLVFILFLVEILGFTVVSAFQLNWGQVLPNCNSPGRTGELSLQLVSIINFINPSQGEVAQL